MSKFTNAKPFEFDGVQVVREADVPNSYSTRVWVGHGLRIGHGLRNHYIEPKEALAVHAFIEAENNVWHEDEDGFRKGRWTMSDPHDEIYVLHHDDFIVPPSVGVSVYWTRATGGLDDHRIAQVVQPVIGSFFAWHAENYPKQPAEPTGLGAVVEVGGVRFVRTPAPLIYGEPWTSAEAFAAWRDILARGPITVLSEGVVAP